MDKEQFVELLVRAIYRQSPYAISELADLLFPLIPAPVQDAPAEPQ